MKRRGWSIRNMIRVKRLMKAVPEAMRGELIVALNLGGRALQAAMRARAPFKTGLVRSAIVFKVFPKTLRLRVGFLGRKRGRSDVFYGRIQDLGRKAQTVTVTRHLQALRQVGNNRNGNTRRTIYSGRPYKMRVRGMPAKRFITGRFPDLRQAINRELKGIWDRALKAIGRGAGDD